MRSGAVRARGRQQTLRAKREVIIAASAINSPKLLMLSGIGPAAHLRGHGIEVIADRPGVGSNLQDHLELYIQQACTQPITLFSDLNLLGKARIGAQWLFFKSGPGATNHFESAAFLRSHAGVEYPDIQFHFLPVAIRYDGTAPAEGHGFQAHVGPMRSRSRGAVRLTGPDPRAAPSILFNYMSDLDDWRDFRHCIRLTREIFGQAAFDPYRGAEISPGAAVESDDALDDFIRDAVESAFHPCGTCKLGDSNDASAVVDPQCRVIGVDALRVADSSIFPRIPNGNLNGPSIMVGEKASDHILGLEPLPRLNHEAWINPRCKMPIVDQLAAQGGSLARKSHRGVGISRRPGASLVQCTGKTFMNRSFRCFLSGCYWEMSEAMSERTYFYVAVGAQLTVHDLDSEQARLRPGATVTAPVPIHYVWCHPAEPLLYVVCSNGGPKGRRGERHVACSFRIDPANGELSPFGPSVELAARPIHCTVDSQGSYLLIAYNIPSALSAHPIAPDGSIAPAVQQAQDLDTGVFAHQVRMTPSNRSAVLVTRGNDAAGAQAEDPGALKVYGMEHGQLNLAASIAPGDGTGLGFGPRHLDFHPNGRWMYVSVERQNELQLYTLDANDNISAQPTFICDSLADRSKPRGTQIASAVHVHPNGRFVYQANRTDQLTDSEAGRLLKVARTAWWCIASTRTPANPNLCSTSILAPDTCAPSLFTHQETC